MVWFSDEVIEAMGFQPNDAGITLTASFFSLNVFEFHGISLPDGGVAHIESEVEGVNYAAAIGPSVNQLSSILSSDDFTDDEPNWQNENKCNGPYLMVKFGPTSEYSITPRYIMMLGERRSHIGPRPTILKKIGLAQCRKLFGLAGCIAGNVHAALPSTKSTCTCV